MDATVAYAKAGVPAICQQWGGDPAREVLARLWRATIAVSHYYDEHISLGMTEEEQRRIPERLRRLGTTPQLICGEYCSRPQQGSDTNLRGLIRTQNLAAFTEAEKALCLTPITEVEGTRRFIATHHPRGRYTLIDLPWVNHESAVFLRDTPAREKLCAWMKEALDEAAPPN